MSRTGCSGCEDMLAELDELNELVESRRRCTEEDESAAATKLFGEFGMPPARCWEIKPSRPGARGIMACDKRSRDRSDRCICRLLSYDVIVDSLIGLWTSPVRRSEPTEKLNLD